MTVMPESLPSEAESATWFDTLSNWGRWGPDDQLGTLNLITEQHRVAAAKLVRTGRTISCARPLQTTFGDPTSAAQMYWVCTGESACAPDGSVLQSKFGTGRVQAALEYVGMVFHGAKLHPRGHSSPPVLGESGIQRPTGGDRQCRVRGGLV